MSSMAYNSAAGFSGMLKEGARHLSNGSDNQGATVTIRNLEACIQLCKMVSSSYGPNGRCKLLINHLGKLNVTSDCAAILREIDIEHPAAQLLAQAVNKQEATCGDNTNYVLTLAGELCYQTIELITKMGGTMGSVGGGDGTNNVLNDILSGYTIALNKIQDELLLKNAVSIEDDSDGDTESTFEKVLKPVLMTKQYGSQDILAPLVAKACLNTMKSTKSKKFNPGSIRTVKILGSSVNKSQLVHGFVAQRGLEVTPKNLANANNNTLSNVKIAVYACGIEASTTEAKGTVTMKNAHDLKSYNLSEEKKMDDVIGSIAASGCKFVVSGGNVSDMAVHYLIKYNIGCLKIGSKWELRRLCQATDAVALVRLGPPTPEEMGFAAKVAFNTLIGSKKVTVFSQEQEDSDDNNDETTTTAKTPSSSSSNISTIILRATTTSVLNDLERAVEDGVRTIEMYTKYPNTGGVPVAVYGGGAIEMTMAIALQEHANTVPGLEQYSIRAFAKSLEVVPRILAQNAGLEPLQIISDLQQVHYNHYHDSNNSDGKSICDVGVDIDTTSKGGGTGSMKEKRIMDLLLTKRSAIRLALDATMTILKIDQIIMSKPSGGPSVPQ